MPGSSMFGNAKKKGINGSTQMKADYVDFQTKPQLIYHMPLLSELPLQPLNDLPSDHAGQLPLEIESGQYRQLLRVDSAPPVFEELTSTSTPFIFKVPAESTKIKKVKSTAVVVSEKSVPRIAGTTTVTNPSIRAKTQIHSKLVHNQTNEQCKHFLTNVVILSIQEPPIIKRNITTLVQELIDDRVKPENFVVRLARLTDSSPQLCLITILRQGLPFLRHVLATKKFSIKGIRPPPGNIGDKISMIGGNAIRPQFKPEMLRSPVRAARPPGTVVSKTVNQSQLKPVMSGSQGEGVERPSAVVGKPVIQSQLNPVISAAQVRGEGRPRTVVRLGDQKMEQRLMTPEQNAIKPDTRLIIRIRSPYSSSPTIVSNTQLPDLRPLDASNQIPNMSPSVTFDTPTPVSDYKFQRNKRVASSAKSKNLAKDNNKKSFPFVYTDNDDTNDVVAMCNINLVEETQSMLRLIEPSEDTPKEEYLLDMQCLQERIKSKLAAKGLDESSQEVAAIISHVAQGKMKHILEKLSVVTEQRLEIKGDSRYGMTNKIEGQLKFLENVDKAQIKKGEEAKREMLVRDASQTGNPEQSKLKAKVKKMQRAETKKIGQKEANITLRRAIGSKKTSKNSVLSQLPKITCRKKATMQDLQTVFENENDLSCKNLLNLSYLK